MEYSKLDKYKASHVDIFDFLISHGYSQVRQSRNEYNFPEIGDSFYVNKTKNVFNWFSHDTGGGPIQCIQAIYDVSVDEAIHILLNGNTQRFDPPTEKTNTSRSTVFHEPVKSDDGWRIVYAYLIITRRLSPDIVGDLAKNGFLYPTKSKNGCMNICFLHKTSSGSTGASFEGTSTYSRFKKEAPPSSKDKGFSIKRGSPDKVYLFEAPIDLMSFMDLHREIDNAVFVSMGGLKHTIAEYYISSGKPVISCVDNDGAGDKFNERFTDRENFSTNSECRNAQCKDFNELLVKIKSEYDIKEQCEKAGEWLEVDRTVTQER